MRYSAFGFVRRGIMFNLLEFSRTSEDALKVSERFGQIQRHDTLPGRHYKRQSW
jgi:hypothetical protein